MSTTPERASNGNSNSGFTPRISRQAPLRAACCAAALLLVIASPSTRAAATGVQLAALFSDSMVLQQGEPVPVWGWAAPGQPIDVRIGASHLVAIADASGRWTVRLPAMAASATPLEMAVSAASSRLPPLVVRDIVVGEVWLASGPSNIFWPVRRCDNAKAEMAAADNANIRFFTVARSTADTPQSQAEGQWERCTAKSVAEASGVGYFFIRRLHQELEVPVGLIQSFWGGSRIEAWTSLAALVEQPRASSILDYWANARKTFNAEASKAAYETDLAQWQEAAERLKSQGRKPAAKPKKPLDPQTSSHRPGGLFNAMVAPLIPYGIRGVITYQGLGNLVWPENSRWLLETQIADWRRRWDKPALPFGMIQPAPYTCDGWQQSRPDAYSIQRASQIDVLRAVPGTGIALTMDIDAANSLHFPQKQPVGARLAAWALDSVYRRPASWRGPLYRDHRPEGSRLRVYFEYAAGLTTSDGKPPRWFEVAGADGVYRAAQAVVDGETVVLASDAVPAPAGVRFAWGNTDVANLVNGEGLPASLFSVGLAK